MKHLTAKMFILAYANVLMAVLIKYQSLQILCKSLIKFKIYFGIFLSYKTNSGNKKSEELS